MRSFKRRCAVPDIFDTNNCAPQRFPELGLAETGTFEDAADAWGFSYGAARAGEYAAAIALAEATPADINAVRTYTSRPSAVIIPSSGLGSVLWRKSATRG
jgi:hypothetical protein